MLVEPINPQRMSSAWLTEVLRDQGVLRVGVRVTAFQVIDAQASKTADTMIVRLWYDDSDPSLPARLFIKLTHPGLEWARREVEFYQTMAAVKRTAETPFVRCYGAWTNAAGQACLLLDDLTQTHFTPARNVLPSASHAEQAVVTLARAHAFWWEKPPLGQRPTTDILDGMSDSRSQGVRAYAEFMGSEVTPTRLNTYLRMVSNWPLSTRRQRVLAGCGLTLIHRDAHPWNFLYPFDPARPAYLIDWQSWRVSSATNDVAYFLTAYWEPGERRQAEDALRHLYFDTLTKMGVQNYTWSDFEYDYRASVIRSAVMLLGGWHADRGNDRRIQRVMSAFDDWQCETLLPATS
jgi:Phosphotransferase enzyme family